MAQLNEVSSLLHQLNTISKHVHDLALKTSDNIQRAEGNFIPELAELNQSFLEELRTIYLKKKDLVSCYPKARSQYFKILRPSMSSFSSNQSYYQMNMIDLADLFVNCEEMWLIYDVDKSIIEWSGVVRLANARFPGGVERYMDVNVNQWLTSFHE